jgi:hypothetical protein
MKIFLSHSYPDKPVVEPAAIRLRDIFGQDSVFYDAWSIQPGDGIIQKMNEGLAAPDFVFFFVSQASLKSKMVELEWQNALYSSTKGKVRIVPVRVDGTAMPAILMQNVWIDMFAQGIEVAIQQIVNVVQGMSTFTPQHEGFQNLSYDVSFDGPSTVLTIRASHLMEPSVRFVVLVENEEGEISCQMADGSPTVGGFNKNVLPEHPRVNGIAIAPLGGAITPAHSLKFKLTPLSKPVVFRGLFHKTSSDEYTALSRRDM